MEEPELQESAIARLWRSAAPERHTQLDEALRARLRARDEPGCRALIAVVEASGGGDDPLIDLWRGLLSSELTRDWGAAEMHFQRVLGYPTLPPALHARALAEMGLLEYMQGRYTHALALYDRSSALAESAGDVLQLARALTYRGIACTAGWMQRELPREKLVGAQADLQRAQLLFTGAGALPSLLTVQNALGALYKELGRYADAVAAYHGALALPQAQQPFTRAALLNNLAELALLRGSAEEAQDMYTEVLAIWRETGGDFELAEALVNLGDAQERRKLLDDAIASYRQAIAAVESLRSRLNAEEARAGLLATHVAPYERLIALYCRRPGGVADAFALVERAKARAFIELLAGHPLRPPQAVPVPLLEREQKLRGTLAHLYQMGVHAGSASPAAARAVALEAELEDLYRRMRRLDAQYAGCRTVGTAVLAAVQADLPGDHLLLEYFGAGEELGCLVITAQDAHAFLLPGLAVVLEDLHRQAGRLGVAPSLLAVTDTALATALSTTALAPLEGYLAGYEHLVIVPHGALHTVPLHALGMPEPLSHSHRVVYAPSASILVRNPTALVEKAPAGTCLALGYGGTDLRYAALEATHVAALTGGTALVGAEATTAALLAHGRLYRSVHLACHGLFSAHAPLASGLLLADGKLDAMTILQQLHLHAALVVLSACDTGHAQVLRGDELMGLARAFLYAGADSVLVSMWPVDDLATMLLMDAFYRERARLPQDRAGLAEALRRAQGRLQSLTTDEAALAASHLELPGVDNLPRSLESAPGREAQARAGFPAPRAGLPDQATGLDGATESPFAHPAYWAAFVLVCK